MSSFSARRLFSGLETTSSCRTFSPPTQRTRMKPQPFCLGHCGHRHHAAQSLSWSTKSTVLLDSILRISLYWKSGGFYPSLLNLFSAKFMPTCSYANIALGLKQLFPPLWHLALDVFIECCQVLSQLYFAKLNKPISWCPFP